MKTSYEGARQRPRLRRFISSPPSVMQAIRSLRNPSAQALLNFLSEKCFGFGRGHADYSYARLGAMLGRSTRVIARASKLLRELGYVTVDLLRDGSYRWRVPVLAEEVKEDPYGALAVRSDVQKDAHPMTETSWGSCQKRHGGYDVSVMGGMTETSWGVEAVDNAMSPCPDWSETASGSEEKTGPKRHLQETYTKRLQQDTSLLGASSSLEETSAGDDEPVDHKGLLKELRGVGVSERVARKLLREHEHELVEKVLRKAGELEGVLNLAGYIVREVQDGGYEDISSFMPVEAATEAKTAAVHSDAPMVSPGVEATRRERDEMLAERAQKEEAYRRSVGQLLERFGQLSDHLKASLKVRWTEHLEKTLPNTPRKPELMKDQKLQKMAFKQVVERFFMVIDQGSTQKDALAQM